MVGKVQALLHEGVWGVDVYVHIFFSVLVGGEWSASRSCRFTPGERARYLLDMRLGGPQSRSGRGGEEKIIVPTGTPTLW
jgi:hypothetical protein